MKQQWTLTGRDLHNLVMAIISHQNETQRNGIRNCTPEEVEEYINVFAELADKLNDIQHAFRIDREDEDDPTSPWMERDLALITLKPKPGDESEQNHEHDQRSPVHMLHDTSPLLCVLFFLMCSQVRAQARVRV